MRFWSDLQGMELSEESNLQWVHAMSVGKYNHPAFGELDFNPQRIQRFADSVNNKVRGIDPDIDYDHKLDPSKGKTAAGWVKKAEARSNGLWLLVEWTDKAKQALKEREYRYFSVEFLKEWANEKGEKLQDVILGGGLTNRPFLKDLVPVNLSELYDEDDNKESGMDRAELIRALGLSEDATDEDIKTKLSELQKSPEIDLSKLDVKVSEEGKIVVSHPDAGDKSWEGEVPAPPSNDDKSEEELAKLAETNPALATMLSEHQKMKEDFKDMQAAARLSEVSTQLSELGSEGKVALPPAASDKFRDVMVQLPKQLSDKVADGLKELLKVGIVELGERAPQSRDGKPPANDDAITVFFSEVEKIKKENKDDNISTADAMTIVKNQNRQMYNDYIEAVESGQSLIEQEA